MQGLIHTHRGAEEAVIAELKRTKLVGKSPLPGIILVTATREQLANFCYTSLSAKGVAEVLATFEAKKPSFSKLSLPEGKNFRVRVKKVVLDDEDRYAQEELIGGKVQNATKLTVKLENPELPLLAFVHEKKSYLTLDLVGRDLSVRQYRVFTHPMSVKGTVAHAVLHFAGYTGQTIVDPFCRSGEFVIEAALQSIGLSPQFFTREFMWQKYSTYKGITIDVKAHGTEAVPVIGFDDLLSHLNAAKKNAKIAGVSKHVTFSKVSVDWLDTKFDEKSVDLIVTQAPHPSKSTKESEAKAKVSDLFYQSKYVLSKKGRVVILSTHEKDFFVKEAAHHGFKLEKEQVLWSGQQPYTMMKFKV